MNDRKFIIDVVVLNYNDSKTTEEFVDRIEKFDNVHEVLIVDNHSVDNSYSILKDIYKDNKKVNIIQTSKNGGYGYGNNQGIRYLWEHNKPEYILLANPDTIIDEPTLAALRKFMVEHPDYSIAAPFMLNMKGEKQYNTAFRIPEKKEYILSLGMLFSKLTHSFYYDEIAKCKDEYKMVGSVSGSLFLMNTRDMIRYGMYDENIFLYCEEVTLGLRLQKAGKKVALLPNLTFIHNHSVSINKSFKSEVKKKQIMVHSKLYVIRKYYHAKGLEYTVACALGQISIFETFLLSLRRKTYASKCIR